MEKYLLPLSLVMISSILFIGKCSLRIALFKSDGSIQILTLSFCFLLTTTMLFTHGVGSVTLAMIPACSNLPSSSLTFSLKTDGTDLGGCMAGSNSLLIFMVYSPGRHPIMFENTSVYLSAIHSQSFDTLLATNPNQTQSALPSELTFPGSTWNSTMCFTCLYVQGNLTQPMAFIL